ncbi:hypothetical protein ACH5RR_017030 [Cinchona calisaya]|uniref:Hydroxyproline-rich glycoprotein family protein n=1 Tax=Cinchona calisaya TaxID=153742 RepID=A0ABD2ZXM3_9GENT
MDTEDRLLEFTMERKEPSDATTRKRIRQSISVPFIWEVIPGTPKKDWKPNTALPKKLVTPPPPLKLIASVPFEWEEKPGTPLPCFSQLPPPGSPLIALAHANINSFRENSCFGGINDDQDGGEEIEKLESCPETSESETTDDSFSSASAPSSLLANGLIPTLAISNAVPVEEIFMTGPASPAASETDSSSTCSSYETGHTSLAGASFLEWLFPNLLTTPQSDFLEKGCVSNTQEKRQQSYDFECERDYSSAAATRKPHTLGELIMMSRRRSYNQRKAVQMRTQNLSKEQNFMKTNALGCCIVGSSNIVGRFYRRWMRQLQLKLMM